MPILRKSVPVGACDRLFPELVQLLPEINKALRNINFGRMDYLPYDEPIAGYELAMRSELKPQGPGKPPSMGHWQLEVIRQDHPYRLILQGKADQGTELAELVFLCGPSPESEPFFGNSSGSQHGGG